MRRISVLTRAAISTVAFVALGCAHKDLLTTTSLMPRQVALRLTTTASAQQLLAPSWIMVLAAYSTPDGFQLLARKFAPLTQGSQQLDLSVDLAPCIAFRATQGKDGCALYVAAALLADTTALGDSTRSVFGESYDSAVPLGPYEVVPGKSPTIPPIDLSMTRFAAVAWQGDEALRLGGGDVLYAPTIGSFGELAATSGVSSGGAVTLYAVGRGPDRLNPNPALQFRFVPQLSVFANNRWRSEAASTLPALDFNAVSAVSTNEVYIASTGGLVRFDGAAFSRDTVVTTPLQSVAATRVSGTTYVVAGSGSGRVWIGRGGVFQQFTLPLAAGVANVCINGPNEAFASINGAGSGVFRFDGTAWTAVQTPIAGTKTALVCPAPGVAYVWNFGGQTAYRWNGSAWVNLPTTGLPPQRQWHFDVASASEVWAYGDSAGVDRVFVRFDGTTWTTVGRSRFTGFSARPWVSSSSGEAYVVSMNARVQRVTTSGLNVVAYQPSLRGLQVTSPTSAVAVGDHGFLARLQGAQWVLDAPPAGTFSDRVLNDVWSDSPSNAWAVGMGSTIYRYAGAGWSLVSDSLRNVATRDNYNGAWGAGTNVWVVGDNSIVHCTSPTSCANESAPGSGALLDVWGASTGAVFAVGEGGRIVRFDGTAWSTMSSPTSRTLARVSGSSATDVWALGDSVMLHYDGSQWASVPMTNGLSILRQSVPLAAQRQNGESVMLALYARGPREVYAGGVFGHIIRFDGNGWTEASASFTRHGLTAIHGTSAGGGCILAVTEANTVQTDPTLLRGVGPTGCFATPTAAPTSWP